MKMNMKRLLATMTLAIVMGACQHRAGTTTWTRGMESQTLKSEKIAPAQEMPAGTPYLRTQESPASMRPVGLCELLNSFNGGAGLYRVGEIVGATEPTNGQPDAFTYVRLHQMDGWTDGAPLEVVARIGGGPIGGDVTKSWDVAIEQGEELGVILVAPRSENRGYYGLHQLGIFRQKDGGLTNGQLLARDIPSVAKMASAIRQFARGDCTGEIRPNPVDLPPVRQANAIHAPKGERRILAVEGQSGLKAPSSEEDSGDSPEPAKVIEGRSGTKGKR